MKMLVRRGNIELFWILILLLCSSLTSVLLGQNREYSLYSAYGLGLKLRSTSGAHITAMGGGGVAYHHPRELNVNNPASYATLSYVSYDIGITLDYREFFSQEGFGTRVSGYLSQLSFAFPYKSMFTLVLGLRPLYRMGYEVNSGNTEDLYTYYGSGDISEAYLSLASSWDKLRFAFSASYIFGSIDRGVVHSSPDTQYRLIKRQQNSIQAAGYRIGLQYDLLQFNQNTLGIGFVFAGSYAGNYRGEESLSSLSSTAVQSTLNLIEIGNQNVKLPLETSVGLMYRMNNVWTILGGYRFSNARIMQEIGLLTVGDNYSYTNEHRFSVGGGHTPEVDDFGNYFEMISYRVGAYFEKKPVIIDNAGLYGYGFNIGLTLPVLSKVSASNIHFAYSFGILESENKTLPREYTHSFLLSLSFFDNWFAEYKYD